MIYGVDDVSRRQYKLFLKDLKTGQTTDLGIANTSGYAVWANDNKTIFYTSNNAETLLSEKIKRHTLGTEAAKDVVVYEEKDKTGGSCRLAAGKQVDLRGAGGGPGAADRGADHVAAQF